MRYHSNEMFTGMFFMNDIKIFLENTIAFCFFKKNHDLNQNQTLAWK